MIFQHGQIWPIILVYQTIAQQLIRGVYFVPKLYNCPKARQVRDENFYDCPQFACCAQWNILKFAHFVSFVESFLKNLANFDIILSESIKIIAKSLDFLINFS